jgi:pyruvate/2-oxoglutarate dehydrogenase complex dihydrolipoamide dehydrogenase (E3) component
MKTFLLLVIGAILGGIATFIIASPLMTGVGAGVGIATGLKSGACLTVEAAKEKGFITSEQVSEVLMAAGRQLATTDVPADESGFKLDDAECQKVIANLKRAAAESK